MWSNVLGQNKSSVVWHALWSCNPHLQSKSPVNELVDSTSAKRFPGPKHHSTAFPWHDHELWGKWGKRVDNWSQEQHAPCMLETPQHLVLKCGLPSHSNPPLQAMLALGVFHQNPKHWPLDGQMLWNSKPRPPVWAWGSLPRWCPSCSSSPRRPAQAC